jgi:hypothetical protein
MSSILARWRRPALVITFLALGLSACARSHRRVDPDNDDEVGGGGTEAQDVRTMADRMSRAILSKEQLFMGEGKPTLHILGLEVRASHPVDKKMVLEMIRTDLVENSEGRLRVLNRDTATLDEIKNERRAKREGAVKGNEKKELLGSDFVLTGSVATISKVGSDGMSSDYWVYNFNLTDLESSEMVWAGKYDFKWAGDKPAIYR